jgi:hypothetical protein
MHTCPGALIIRSLLLMALLFSVVDRSQGADPSKSTPASSANAAPAASTALTPADGQAMGMAALTWLSLLDEGKYAENFATSSESFRKGFTLKAWTENHPVMQKEFGAVVSRDLDNVNFKTRTSQSDGKETVTYTMTIKTKFAKKTGTENVRMEKESGEWKVADYAIEQKF